MGWVILKHIFSTLLAMVNVRRLSDQEKDLEILVLRQQLSILQRKLNHPIKPSRQWSIGVNRVKLGLDQAPERVDLADIVNQSEPRTRPLYIHFTFSAQGEALHVLMHTDVGKDRFDNAQPSRIDFLAMLAVELGFHQIDQVRLAGIDLNGKIPARSVQFGQIA